MFAILSDNSIECNRDVKVMTSEGTFTGPLKLFIDNSKLFCQRDIDEKSALVGNFYGSINDVYHSLSLWMSSGAPRDQDGRVIPFSIAVGGSDGENDYGE